MTSKKGVSLPVNAIVILILAIIVLGLIVAFFMGGALSSTGQISDQQALSRGCVILQSQGCTGDLDTIKLPGYDADKNPATQDTLKTACDKVFNDDTRCKAYCCGESGTAAACTLPNNCVATATCAAGKQVAGKTCTTTGQVCCAP